MLAPIFFYDRWTTSNKIAISKFRLNAFGKKRVCVRGVSRFPPTTFDS